MPSLRQLLLKLSLSPGSSYAVSQPNVQEMKLPLPVELLLHIISYINFKKDLINITRTCRLFRAAALPLMYKTTIVNDSGEYELDYRQQMLLYRSLQSQPTLQVVTTVYLYLARWRVCVTAPTSRGCNCDKLDRQLGKALDSLPNLEVLHLKCHLCWSKLGERHQHLALLQTNKLRELLIRCRCSAWVDTQNLTENILSSSAMNSLTALGLEWSISDGVEVPASFTDLFANPRFLPALSALYHDGSPFSDTIVAKRPITRLSYHPLSPGQVHNLHDLLKRGGTEITHLYVDNILSWLPGSIKEDPELYRHLKYVGPLHFKKDEPDMILSKMQPLSSLTQLEWITVTALPDTPNYWDEKFLLRIQRQHTSIRKIYYSPRPYSDECVLWDLTDKWRRRAVDQLNYWDMLNGTLESL